MRDDEILQTATRDGCKAIKGYYDDEKNVCSVDGTMLKFDSITSVNFKPHAYMITPRHLEHTTGGMYLDESAIRRAEQHGIKCGWKDCYLPREQHTSDKAMFLKVKSDKDLKDIEQLSPFLFGIKPLMEQNKIDGVAFVKWEGDD